jgi:hypothetical protein
MASWRDTTPQPVQDDLDAVVSSALDSALSMLTKRGEFFPFGVTVSGDGDVALAAADPGLGEHPDSTSVLASLYAGAAGNRAAFRAAAFAADVRANGGDAVRVEAEHRDGGPALVVLMPYAKKGLVKKTVAYGQMSVSAGERRVWEQG